MQINAEDVAKIAALSKLSFSEADLAQYTQNMRQILELVEQLSHADPGKTINNETPLHHQATWRVDEVVQSLDRAQLLSLAPEHEQEHYLVPKVLD